MIENEKDDWKNNAFIYQIHTPLDSKRQKPKVSLFAGAREGSRKSGKGTADTDAAVPATSWLRGGTSGKREAAGKRARKREREDLSRILSWRVEQKDVQPRRREDQGGARGQKDQGQAESHEAGSLRSNIFS